MGNYFANLHIRNEKCSLDALKTVLADTMTARGFLPSEKKDADVSVCLYTPPSGAWVSVYSDAFLYTDVLALSPVLAEKTAGDVLSIACFDSDYLFLQLLNTEKKHDLWLNVGSSYELKPPKRSNLASWKKAISDFDTFKAAASEKYPFAEDFLKAAEGALALPYEQSVGSVGTGDAEWLYYKSTAETPSEPPALALFLPSMMPCRPKEPQMTLVTNVGGASRGVCAMLVGDYVEHDEITVDSAEFICHNARGERIYAPITFEKRETEGGGWCYYWEDPDFVIPPPPHENLPPRVRMEKTSSRAFGLRCTLSGNPRKFLDVCVVLAPLANFEKGSAAWLVWRGYPSKRAYVEEYNEEQREMAQFGMPVELYDPNDFDLD